MLGMAKKRTSEDDHTKDRHKPRRTVALAPSLYAQLEEFARRNHRPVLWQLRLILEAVLEQEGLWPPPARAKD